MSSSLRYTTRPNPKIATITAARPAREQGSGAVEADATAPSPAANNDVLATFTIDADGRIISWSDGAAICHGHHPNEIVGLPFASTYPAVDRTAGQHESALKTARTKGSFKDAGWRVRKDGSRFWAHVTIDALRDERGDVVGFANVTRDVTVLQRSGGMMRRLNALELALNNMSPGVAMFDADERLCLWNENWKLLTASTRSLLYGATFVEVIRGSLEDRGVDPRSEGFATMVGEERKQHLLRLAQAGDASFSDEVQANGRTQLHSHRAMRQGGWITTVFDVRGPLVSRMHRNV